MNSPFSSALFFALCVILSLCAVWFAIGILRRTERSRVKAEAQLGQTQARLNSALIASEIGTWEWDIVNDRVFADKNLAAMFRVSPADMFGGKLAAYTTAIHPDDIAQVNQLLDEAINAGHSYNCEYRLQRPDGPDRWVLARGKVSRDGSSKATSLSGVVLDVTAQRQVELELRRSEARTLLALESAGLGMWSVEPRTMELTTDARFREIFGVTGSHVSYEDAVAAIHADDQKLVQQAVAASTRAENPAPYALEYRVCLADGSVRWVFAKGRANTDAAGNVVSFDGTMADISDRKSAEYEREQLLESERSARSEAEKAGRIKDEFLATLSHEIRTPLSAILGWSHMMRSPKFKDDFGVGLATIERNARAQAKIIEDLLDMSRIMSGKVRLDIQRVDLAIVVNAAVETARPAADAKGVKLDAAIDPLVAGVTIKGDGNRLQQVMWNLISNAVKFTPKGGCVHARLDLVHSNLEISVIDSGEGIDSAFLPFVFDRFRQADATTTRHHGGLGLGLSIVKHLTELHGGTVRVSSAGRGHGAAFVITMPLSAPRPEPEPGIECSMSSVDTVPSVSPPPEVDISSLRVLVVDDEPDARELLKRLLEDNGAFITEAASAEEALQLLKDMPFDVLVSDIGMPGSDGYSLIRRVRGLNPGGGIPAIALTAYARAEDRVRAIAAGFQMHVSKPVEPIELITMVAGAAGRTARLSPAWRDKALVAG